MEMQLFAPNLIGIGIHETDGNDYAGSIWHQYSEGEISFQSITEMISRMEQLYDQWNYPQNSTYIRTFADEPPERRMAKQFSGQRRPDWMKDRRGKLATFVVHVRYRQNVTWQGEAAWIEKQKRFEFSSMLEFLKILDHAMREEREP